MPVVRVSNEAYEKLRRLAEELGAGSIASVVDLLIETSLITRCCSTTPISSKLVLVRCGEKTAVVPRTHLEDLAEKLKICVDKTGEAQLQNI